MFDRRTLCCTTLMPLALLGPLVAPASGWDEEGHEIIAQLAYRVLPESMPAWLKTPEIETRLVYLSTEPDRWRGQHHAVLDHINNPDHYIDEELLPPYGLSMRTLPRFRREFIDLMATQRALHPERFKPYRREKDKAYTRLAPGFAPYRIAELQWKIAANWTELKTYERYRGQATEEMIRNARENVVYLMGILGHYVGDMAQPLHTTIHHHGWKGVNPKGYTTDYDFHESVDGVMIRFHGITAASLLARARAPKKITPQDSWEQILAYIHDTYEHLEPLYMLEKTGELKKEAGKAFIEDRLLEGGSVLAGLWVAAHEAAVIDEFRVQKLLERRRRTDQPQDRKTPTSQKAATSAPQEGEASTLRVAPGSTGG